MADTPLFMDNPDDPRDPRNLIISGVPESRIDEIRREAAERLAENNPGHEGIRKMSEEDLIRQKEVTEELRKQARLEKEKELSVERTNKALKKAREGDQREMRRLAKQAGLWDSDKGYIIRRSDGKPEFINPDEFDKALKRGDRIVNQLSQNVAVGAIGAAEPTSKGFRFSELFHAISTGNFGMAIGELAQPFGGDEGVGERMIQRGLARRAAAGAGAGGMFDKVRGLGLMAAGRFVGPAGLIAVQQFATRAIRQGQETVREGQVTGEGFGAGVASRFEALRLAGTPFDMLDRRTAAEIVRGVRSKGFRGELGRALQDSIGTVFKDLGTDWAESLELLNTVVKNNIMSVDDFTQMMTGLDDIAKETSLSVKSVQDNLSGIITAAATAGGPEAAAQAAETFPGLIEAFKGTSLAQRGQLDQFIQQALPTLAATFGGIPTMFGNSEEAQRNAGRYLDMLTDFLWDMKEGGGFPNNAMFAQYLIGTRLNERYLPGFAGAAEITQFLNIIFEHKRSGKTYAESFARERAEAVPERAEKEIVPTGLLSRIGASQGPIYQSGVMKNALQELKQGMLSAGVEEGKINEILREARRPVFQRDGKTLIERSKEFRSAFAEASREAEREIRVVLEMPPEASRYFSAQNKGWNDHVYFGKSGTQNTVRPPAMRGG